MKKISSILFPLLLASALLAGCDDDAQPPFEGIDNHIVAFALTAPDGTVYEAAITGDRIAVTVPHNVSLAGARASWKLCEQAVLYPDPLSITDWDNEQRFRVMAYDQTLRDYAYSVIRTDVPSRGSVTLLTQSDVAALAATGATTIDGNLIIGDFTTGGQDPVADLSPLAGITDVRYNIVVNNSFAGKELSGLVSLRSAGGLILGSATTPLTTAETFDVDLPALETLGQLTVNSTTLTGISLNALTRTGPVQIAAPNMVYANLPELRVCDGDLIVAAAGNAANKALRILQLSKLEQVAGSMALEYQTAMTHLDLDALSRVGGNLSLKNLTSLTALLLPELQFLGGSFSWSYLTSASSLRIPKLARVEALTITDNTASSRLEEIDLTALSDVTGELKIQTKYTAESLRLPALRTIGGQFTLHSLPNLLSLEVPALAACGSIYFYALPLLPSLDLSSVASLDKLELISCYKLARVKTRSDVLKDVALNGGSRLCDFTRFEGARTISGTLSISNYTQNTELAFPGIKSIGAYIQTNGNRTNNSVTMTFPDLETVGTFKISSCTWLKELDAPKLRSVETWDTSFMSYITEGKLRLPELRTIGTFKFWGGTYASAASQMRLTNLDDFAGVTRIGSVDIAYWGKLTDFSGLHRALGSLSADRWKVVGCAYNPTWKAMQDGLYTQP